jgi:hypothetical protein
MSCFRHVKVAEALVVRVVALAVRVVALEVRVVALVVRVAGLLEVDSVDLVDSVDSVIRLPVLPRWIRTRTTVSQRKSTTHTMHGCANDSLGVVKEVLEEVAGSI